MSTPFVTPGGQVISLLAVEILNCFPTHLDELDFRLNLESKIDPVEALISNPFFPWVSFQSGRIVDSHPMNGHTPRYLHHSANAPAYSLLRDINGAYPKQDRSVGRYTAVSKSTTKRGGETKGAYPPTTHTLNDHHEHGRRAHSQQNLGRVSSTNVVNIQNNHEQKWTPNGSVPTTHAQPYPVNGGGQWTVNHCEPQHNKSHSVTSTVFLQNTSKESIPFRIGSRSAGGSLSCGQPSPSSTAEDSTTDILSPTASLKVESRPQHQSFWLHQSEIALPTDRDYTNGTVNGIYERPERRITSVTNLDSESANRTLGNSETSINQKSNQYFASSAMIYSGHGSRNGSDDYLNSYPTGPSHRKIQNLHGTGGAQRRFPSDTTLNFTQREGAQVYTSGNKPGPVTIPARSRSAQPSPGPSPAASPNTFYRSSESSLIQDYGADKRSRLVKPHHVEMNYTTPSRGTSSPPNLEKQKMNSFSVDGPEDENESQILPSVREIIRQVEAMTQSNAATSTTDISTIGQTGQSAIPRYQRQLSQPIHHPLHQQRRTVLNTEQTTRTSGIIRQPGSSQRTPSAPQLRGLTQYTPIQAKFNAAVCSSKSPVPPVPPHGTTRSKAIIGAITRRVEPSLGDGTQRQDYSTTGSSNKKTELLSHLPTDYQKLREAFIEQRREIQRLRKQLAEKDILINQLQTDIRLYEPWR
ncbi:unnamed protein product [Calicophoron daubneyi]|uniref:Uncharacterized protein n=1 Tax=Calicophoron daubneyi TaxID=300641 RepID=A0AAV2TYJ0_CALDB